jgi:hypothetical protein
MIDRNALAGGRIFLPRIYMRVIVLNLTRRTDRRDMCLKEFNKFGFKNVEWLPSWDADDFKTAQNVVQRTRSNSNAKVWFLDWVNESDSTLPPTAETAEHNAKFNAETNKRWIAKVCCAESHRSAWCRVAHGDDDWALILEDDFKICRDFSTLQTPPDDCEFPIWSVGRSYWANKQGYNGMDAYIIHKRTAAALIKYIDICVENRPYWRTTMSLDNGLQQAVEQGLFKPKVGAPLIIMWESPSDIERGDKAFVPRQNNGGASEQDLQIHLQNLANQGTLTVRIACTDTEAVKIGFWNDCIVKERNEDILTFFKRTPALPSRPWQDEIMKNIATITTAVENLPAVDPEGNVITDISGYIMDVTKFDNRRR